MNSTPADIFDPRFVRALFDEMSGTYGIVNYISSFGFCERWRRACVANVTIKPGDHVHDWMAGMGELWGLVLPHNGPHGSLVAADLSPVMCGKMRARQMRFAGRSVAIQEIDILNNAIPDASVDVIVCSFGLKTFSEAQQRELAREVRRVLKPGGRYSFLEISVPPAAVLRAPYLFYVKHVIPVLGRVMLGNPDNYRMLGVYTTAFGNCTRFAAMLSAEGLDVTQRNHFWGCATSVFGTKSGEQI